MTNPFGGRDIATLDATTHRLPALTEGTLPAALGKGVANGLAALNGAGKVVDAAGNVAASIGTTAGTAADAAATTTSLNGKAAATDVTANTTALATKVENKGSLAGIYFSAATPTNANLVAAGLTASPTARLLIISLGQ